MDLLGLIRLMTSKWRIHEHKALLVLSSLLLIRHTHILDTIHGLRTISDGTSKEKMGVAHLAMIRGNGKRDVDLPMATTRVIQLEMADAILPETTEVVTRIMGIVVTLAVIISSTQTIETMSMIGTLTGAQTTSQMIDTVEGSKAMDRVVDIISRMVPGRLTKGRVTIIVHQVASRLCH